jgi:Holliday junction resolvasome RuvABC endonuclease subunit
VRLLALDLSTHVGWAFFADRSALTAHDTWHAPERHKSARDDFGPMFLAFESWLIKMLLDHRPDVVAFEAPILPRTRVFQKQRAIRMSYGWACLTEKICFGYGKRCIEAHPSTVKVALASNGKASKKQMIAAAVRRDFIVTTEHEADACGVALVAFEHCEPAQLDVFDANLQRARPRPGTKNVPAAERPFDTAELRAITARIKP